jgi:xylulokinase
MLWLREHAPEVWARTHKLLDVSDYIVQRLTGRFVTSFDRAHLTWLFDARPKTKGWSAKLIKHVGLDAALLPEVLGATAMAGELRGPAAEALGLRAGTPVTAGLGDLSAAAIASGAMAHGAPHLNVGTSSWLGAHLPKSRVNPLTNIGSICAAAGNDYLLIATQENAGACVNWALNALGFGANDFASFAREAEAAPLDAGAPMFLPWLGGERVPVDAKQLRGGFIGLSLCTARGAMARAVYEGVALNMRWAMRDFDRLSGGAGKPLRFVGGGANSALWCQMFADVLERPVERVDAAGLSGARGAAMTAAVAAGWHPDLAAAAALVKTDRRFEPDGKLSAFYGERFKRFAAAYARLRPWYDRKAPRDETKNV